MKETVYSLPMIARYFGGRDHTTILKGAQVHARRMQAAQCAVEAPAVDIGESVS
jgi:chromosomal replication initiation ATPase DnaA